MVDARLAAGLTVVIAVAAAGVVTVGDGDRRLEVSERVGDADSPDGWQTIEYEGVRVDIPGEWRRMDTSGCAFRVERWGAPGSDPCGRHGAGVSFLDDMGTTRYGPGEVRAFRGGSVYNGFVQVSELAVSADGTEQVVMDVLASTHGVRAP